MVQILYISIVTPSMNSHEHKFSLDAVLSLLVLSHDYTSFAEKVYNWFDKLAQLS